MLDGKESSMLSGQDGIQFSVRSPEYIKDPYSAYRMLREWDPVHFSKDGYWFVTKYSDVSAALRDPRLRNSPAQFSLLNRRNVGKYLAADVANRMIAFLDPPDHTVPRRLISTTFQEFILREQGAKAETAWRASLYAIAGKDEIDLWPTLQFRFPCAAPPIYSGLKPSFRASCLTGPT